MPRTRTEAQAGRQRWRNPPSPKLWTTGEIARLLGVHQKTVNGWVDSGALPGAKAAEDCWRRVHQDDLRDFLVRRGFTQAAANMGGPRP